MKQDMLVFGLWGFTDREYNPDLENHAGFKFQFHSHFKCATVDRQVYFTSLRFDISKRIIILSSTS